MFAKFYSKKKNGISLAFPDVCKTPTPAGMIPIPYPNIQFASFKLKAASVKIKNFDGKFKQTMGDDASASKDVTASIRKISAIFSAHASTVSSIGKQASKPMLPNQATKVFQQAKKRQKSFENQVKRECDNLLNACKDDKEQQKLAKTLVSMVGSAARGHPL